MLPATVGPVYWKMITYCVPNDKSAQWHVALLSWPDPSLIVSVVSFLYTTLALICRNDRPHIRGTSRIPSASLSLSSLRPPHCHPPRPSPSSSAQPEGADVVEAQNSGFVSWRSDITAAGNSAARSPRGSEWSGGPTRLLDWNCFNLSSAAEG